MKRIKEGVPLEDFKAFLRFKNISYKELSNVLKVTISTVSDKINNRNNRQFEQHELFKLIEHLRLNNDEIVKYFFPENLRNVS